jgi:hypothetical protein
MRLRSWRTHTEEPVKELRRPVLVAKPLESYPEGPVGLRAHEIGCTRSGLRDFTETVEHAFRQPEQAREVDLDDLGPLGSRQGDAPQLIESEQTDNALAGLK